MALTKTIASAFGLEAINAYHRVERVMLVTNDRMTFRLRSYATVDFPPFADRGFSCDYDLNGENPVRQAYLHLRTLDEFADAVDC